MGSYRGSPTPNITDAMRMHKKYVIGRVLQVNQIKGRLPDSIGNLTNLEMLKVKIVSTWNFQLSATLSKLTKLIRLELSLSGYQGSFPDEILSLKNLEHLFLGASNNPPSDTVSFYGPVPAPFCDLHKLKRLWFSYTAMSGFEICSGKLPNLEVLSFVGTGNMSLPLQSLLVGRSRLKMLELVYCPVFGHLELAGQLGLERIFVTGTDISGTLPPSLFDNELLVNINLVGVNIGGTLPTSIGRLKSLQTFDIRNSHISGAIPVEIGLCESLQTIQASNTRLSGRLPTEIGNLSNLKTIQLGRTMIDGTIPTSFNQLSSLVTFSLSASNIAGTIPQGFLALPNLEHINVGDCRLTGTIPDEISTACRSLGLGSNSLDGTIPFSALRHCEQVRLQENHLSGQIGDFSLSSTLRLLKLSGNNLLGPLPVVSNRNSPLSLDFSFNHFSGTIPDHYRTIPLDSIDLTYNQLVGPISVLIENESLVRTKLGYNRFSGTIPNSISRMGQLMELSISNNLLSGTIPALPTQLTTLSASANLFGGTLDNVIPPGGPKKALQYLDLSHNFLEGPPPPASSLSPFSFLSLASNNLTGSVGIRTGPSPRNLQVLDLSNNRIEGQFPFTDIPLSTSKIILANNSLSGTIPPLRIFDQLSVLDISKNQFSFDASILTSNPLISLLSVQNNHIYGTLTLIESPSLKYADFSHNAITKFQFYEIHQLSEKASLSSISIKSNPAVESRADFEQLISEGALVMSSSTAPSVEHQGVICSQLMIGDNHNTQFEYDESMFSFQQCQCDRDHFGFPPFQCYSCDSLNPGSKSCNGNVVIIEHDYYVYNDSVSLHTEMCVSQLLYSIGQSRLSNCLGILIQYEANGTTVVTSESPKTGGSSVFVSEHQLSLQCHVGSTGRRCSRCKCDITSIDRICYFSGPAGICKRCGKVFSPNEYIPLSLGVLIVVLVVLSIIFYLILASKRRSKELEWRDLSIGKRCVYRLDDLMSFGQITILVTFIQIVVELTHWDDYALSSWLKVVNGEAQGLGLRCLFPFLSNPVASLLARLLFPIFVIAIVCASIGLGESIHRFKSYLKLRNSSRLNSDTSTTVGDGIPFRTAEFGITSLEERKRVPYPAIALVTSTSISIIKFLYFGTTMAAAEYLFYSIQKGTNKKYVQSVPWLSFEDARTLRMVSIPFLVLYLFGIPFAFIVTSWKIRHTISSRVPRLYFGSLFENYHKSFYWWEMVNVLRKLIVALLLRGLSPVDSFRPFFICLNLAFLGVNVLALKPWKRSSENYLDGIGSVLLILSLASDLLGPMVHSHQVQVTIAVLDGIYVAVCLFFIVWRMLRDETSYEKEWKLKFGQETHDSMKLPSEDYAPLLGNESDVPSLSSEWHELS